MTTRKAIPYDANCVECRREAGRPLARVTRWCYGHLERQHGQTCNTCEFRQEWDCGDVCGVLAGLVDCGILRYCGRWKRESER